MVLNGGAGVAACSDTCEETVTTERLPHSLPGILFTDYGKTRLQGSVRHQQRRRFSPSFTWDDPPELSKLNKPSRV